MEQELENMDLAVDLYQNALKVGWEGYKKQKRHRACPADPMRRQKLSRMPLSSSVPPLLPLFPSLP
jgi:hypothetical protein